MNIKIKRILAASLATVMLATGLTVKRNEENKDVYDAAQTSPTDTTSKEEGDSSSLLPDANMLGV